jgi:hypothetical protein
VVVDHAGVDACGLCCYCTVMVPVMALWPPMVHLMV